MAFVIIARRQPGGRLSYFGRVMYTRDAHIVYGTFKTEQTCVMRETPSSNHLGKRVRCPNTELCLKMHINTGTCV